MSRIFPWILCVVLIVIVVWVWRVKKPPTPPAAAHGTLVIQDPHAALWMPIDNAHTDPGDSRWDGILIQVGKSRYSMHDGQKTEPGTLHFMGVRFEGPEGATVELVADAQGNIPFGWINIVAENPGHQAPITFEQSRLLYPTTATTGCTEAEAGDVPQPCLRMRSLSPNLIPEAVITYWQGPNGYRLDAAQVNPQPGAFNDPHNSFTFQLKDKVKVEIYEPGSVEKRMEGKEAEIAALGPIVTITIRASHFAELPDHGEVHDPPIYWEGL